MRQHGSNAAGGNPSPPGSALHNNSGDTPISKPRSSDNDAAPVSDQAATAFFNK